jgi:hypothetical protein
LRSGKKLNLKLWISMFILHLLNIFYGKGSINCSIPASSQVPLPGQQDEEVAAFLGKFKNARVKKQ